MIHRIHDLQSGCWYDEEFCPTCPQVYDPKVLLMHLLLLQLLAADQNKLAELKPTASAAVAAALAAATHAAQLGAQPLLVAAAEAAEIDNSSNSSRGRGVSIQHLAAQYGVLAAAAAPTLSLPWLQFLNSYHAVHSALTLDQNLLRSRCARKPPPPHDPIWPDLVPDQPDHGPGLSPMFNPDASLAAAAAVLLSYPSKLVPRLVGRLCVESGRFCRGKVPAVPLSWLPHAVQLPEQQQTQQNVRVDHSGLQQQQQQQQAGMQQSQQQQQQQKGSNAQGSGSTESNDPLLACGYWLHAERLLTVHPSHWQQYLLTNSQLEQTGANGSHLELIADLCCDWCGKAMRPTAATTTGKGAAASSKCASHKRGCAGCGSAQYCSDECATAGGKIHRSICW